MCNRNISGLIRSTALISRLISSSKALFAIMRGARGHQPDPAISRTTQREMQIAELFPSTRSPRTQTQSEFPRQSRMTSEAENTPPTSQCLIVVCLPASLETGHAARPHGDPRFCRGVWRDDSGESRIALRRDCSSIYPRFSSCGRVAGRPEACSFFEEGGSTDLLPIGWHRPCPRLEMIEDAST